MIRYYSVYDLLLSKTKSTTEEDLLLFLKEKLKINKSQALSLKENTFIPYDKSMLNKILNYLEISELELQLLLGIIPPKYQEIYNKNIKKIANILNDSYNIQEKLEDENSITISVPFFKSNLGTLYKGDVLDLFKLVDNDSIDCVFADPPFNLNKQYDTGVTDQKSISDYLTWCTLWLDECIRVLKPGGSLFIYNLPKWNIFLANHLNKSLKFMNQISIDLKATLPIANRLYPSHYSLLYYIKGDKPKTFNNQRVPLQTCRHCGGEIKDYGGYKNKMNPLGVNLSDVWTDIFPVRHSNSKNRNFNELPVKLLDRIITMATNERDIILDPFGGSGTTFAVAELLNRKWLGFELGNCNIIKDRLLNKDNDRELLKKVESTKNVIFPSNVQKLRKKNGFWLSEDFSNS